MNANGLENGARIRPNGLIRSKKTICRMVISTKANFSWNGKMFSPITVAGVSVNWNKDTFNQQRRLVQLLYLKRQSKMKKGKNNLGSL